MCACPVLQHAICTFVVPLLLSYFPLYIFCLFFVFLGQWRLPTREEEEVWEKREEGRKRKNERQKEAREKTLLTMRNYMNFLP